MTPASSLEYDSSNVSPEISPKRPVKKPAMYESRSSFSSLHSDDFIFHPDDISVTDMEDRLKSN
jgi:hypothetical protein